MNILVTGGTGFIGSHLVEFLQARGHHVRCLVRKGSKRVHGDDKGVDLFYGDVVQREDLASAVRGIDSVVHLAAVQTQVKKREQFFQVNVSGTKNLIDAVCRFAPHLKKFVYVSSISAVGPRVDPTPLTEDSPCAPIDAYGESKLGAEKLVLDYRKKVPVTIIRPPLVYGPRDAHIFGVLRYAKMAKKGISLRRAAAETYTSIIHVRDLCEGLIRSVENAKAAGEKYFLCNGDPTSFGDISGLSAIALERRIREIVIPSFILDTRAFLKTLYAKAKHHDVPTEETGKRNLQTYWICDGSKARRELNFAPAIPLAEGIRETVLWYKDRGWL